MHDWSNFERKVKEKKISLIISKLKPFTGDCTFNCKLCGRNINDLYEADTYTIQGQTVMLCSLCNIELQTSAETASEKEWNKVLDKMGLLI